MGMGSEEGALPKPLVHIPSYSQVLEDSRPQPPPSLFRASSQSSSLANPNLSSRSDSPAAAAAVHVGGVSDDTTTGIQASAAPRLSERRVPFTEASSFTEAFSFLRSTEFYSPPPPPPAAPSPPAPASGLGSGPRSSLSNGNPLAANQQRYVPQ